MYMKKRKINDNFYWSLVESYRDNGKVKQRIIKNLGTTVKAIEILESNIEYKEYLDQLKTIVDQDKVNVISKRKRKNNHELKEHCFKLTKAEFKYIAVRKNCVQETIKISYKSLETIVEMAVDYVQIIRNKVEEMKEDEFVKRTNYAFKANEIEKIGNDIAKVIQYSKSCTVSKPILDVGMDAFSLMVNRKKR